MRKNNRNCLETIDLFMKIFSFSRKIKTKQQSMP